MADFERAFLKTLKAEGGDTLTDAPLDRGRQTYAGISRRYHPNWAGWSAVDRRETPDNALVESFYHDAFWTPLRANEIAAQDVANLLYDFAVNAGIKSAVKLAQKVLGLEADGILGPQTIAAINAADAKYFAQAYTLAKITHYRDIVRYDGTQRVFLMGWLNRALDQIV